MIVTRWGVLLWAMCSWWWWALLHALACLPNAVGYPVPWKHPPVHSAEQVGNGRFYTLETGANERRWSKVKDKVKSTQQSFVVVDRY